MAKPWDSSPSTSETLDYLRETGRTDEEVELVERYAKEQHLFRRADDPPPTYSKLLHLDLNTVEPSLAGPKRPQDRVALRNAKQAFHAALSAPVKDRGFALSPADIGKTAAFDGNTLSHGTVVIAAITSCTNTSNPSVMLAAGLLAKKAVEKGLKVKSHVKTSLAPGSRVVTDYLEKTGLDKPLDQLGFQTVGYGCTTCIGNSGPLPDAVAKAVTEANLVAAAVLSGNRNFEGRINPLVKANYLASPPMVVAYALAGTIDLDLTTEPLGTGSDGMPVFLRDIWPTEAEIEAVLAHAATPEMFRRQYANIFQANETWNALPVAESELFPWDEKSTYIQEPPFLLELSPEPQPIQPIINARALAVLGDSVTTDHISPAGFITAKSPGWKISHRARRLAGRFQQLRVAARKRPGDDPRHVRQYPHPQFSCARHGGRRHPALARRRTHAHLRRGHAIQGPGRAAYYPCRRRIRLRLQPRLGRQGHAFARRSRGHRRQLRADSPQQPGRHGRAAARNSRPA